MSEWISRILWVIRSHHKSGLKSSFILSLLPVILTAHLAQPLPLNNPPSEPRFFRLTTANGLSHDIVYAIVQDSRGFLWFGTQYGLNRYDGYTFTIFRHLRSNPQSLVQNTVQALRVDSAGTLWVGTAGGLDCYDRDSDSFSHYP